MSVKRSLKMFRKTAADRQPVLVVSLFVFIGLAIIISTRAAVPTLGLEPEKGNLSSNTEIHTYPDASGGQAVHFHSMSDHIPEDQLPKSTAKSSDQVLVRTAPLDPVAGDGVGSFRTTCAYSHMSYDDPIVYPGKPGAAHLHTFFGNTSINFASTYANMTQPGVKGNCAGGAANLSAYWVPTLMNGPTPLVPSLPFVYYKSGYRLVPAASVQDVPAGLKMVAGDKNSKTGQSPEIVNWSCIELPFAAHTTIPSCPAGNTLEMAIDFPQCWDGVSLDSPNHISHLRYPGSYPAAPGTLGSYGDGCSKEMGYTTPIPVITVKVQWVVPSGGSANLRLSSDMDGALPGASAHADYIEGWDRSVEQTFAQHCIRGQRSSTRGLCNGTSLVDTDQFP